MKIKFLGTAAAEGIPALFCNCAYCKQVRRTGKGIRTRSQVIVNDELSIDFPPDVFTHAVQGGMDFSGLKYLLVTHSHIDHFYPQDLVLRGYKYATDMTAPTLNIYGNSEVAEVFEEGTRRELKCEVKDGLKVHTVSAFTPFTVGAYTVVALPATHTSKDPFVYLVEGEGKRYLHLTDTGLLSDGVYEYLKGKHIDLVTLDCTFLLNGAPTVRRHMGVEDNAAVLSRLFEVGAVDENTKKVITHFSHNAVHQADAFERAEQALGAIAAYDGLEIEV